MPTYSASVPPPTKVGIRYGDHRRHVLDLWQAESSSPTPLVIVIHGGGWNGGSKERLDRFVDTAALLKQGISVAAINYRLLKHARDVEPPVKAPLHDAARAVQFVRSQAAKWNVGPTRLAAAGGSAGACSSLWVAYHDDLADPTSADPVARFSSRLFCVAVTSPQTTLDPELMRTWISNGKNGGHAFGLADRNIDTFLAARKKMLPLINEYSPYSLVSKDDPPTYLFFTTVARIGQEEKDPTHSANYGVMLQKRCREFGVPCECVFPGATDMIHKTPTKYLIATLKKSP